MDDTAKGFSCHCTTKSYHLIENYRSVLDRKQPEISTWKILDHAGQISFTRGAHYRRGSDVLAIRLNRLYLIHPWYEYVDIDQQLFAGVQPKRSSQILEVVLLERVDPTGEQGFELAIVECPCLEKQGVFCTHCQCTLTAMKEVHLCASRNIARSLDQQTVVSVSLGISQDRIDSVEQSVSSTVIAVQVRFLSLGLTGRAVLHRCLGFRNAILGNTSFWILSPPRTRNTDEVTCHSPTTESIEWNEKSKHWRENTE